MPGKTIATIYFYLISAGSLVLIVVGIFNIVNFIINSTMYERYPLRWGGVSNCETIGTYPRYDGPYAPAVSIAPDKGMATPSAEQIQKDKEYCLKNEEAERTKHRVDNLRDAITFTLVGLVLFGIHFPQARKRSN